MMRPNGRFTFWSVWIFFSLAFLVCRVALFDSVFYNIDEAEYSVAAQALSHGEFPGVDLLGSSKPPGIVSLVALIFVPVGRNVLALQIVAFMLWLVLLYLTMRLAREMFPDVPEWMSGLSFFLIANSFGLPRDMHALNTELPAMVLASSGLLVAARAKRPRDLILSGVLIGVASVFRQNILLVALVAPFFHSVKSSASRQAFFAAIMFPWITLILVYAVHGGLGTALDAWFRYPFVYSGDTGLSGFLQAAYLNNSEFAIQAFVPVLFSLVGVFLAWSARNAIVLVLLCVSLAAVAVGSRFFGHYYIQAMPALAIFSAVGLNSLYSSKRFRLPAKAAIAVGVIVALLHFPFWRYWDESAPPKGVSAESLDGRGLEVELGRFAMQNSTPDESIFVWGYCPQVYFHANRLPGARDFIVHYVTGISPGSTAPRANYRADAEQMLLDDIKLNKPKLIFDLSFLDYNPYLFTNYPLTKYPALADYIVTAYKPIAQVGSVPIYTLNSDIY
jgi:hypothetical protein